MPNKNDYIYTAALVDGEGTVTLTRHHKNENRRPELSITNTTWALIEYLQTTYGGSVVTKKSKKSHHKQAWIWRLTYNPAIKVLEKIVTYMKEPVKQARAKLILQEFKKVTVANGKYSPEQRLAKDAFEERFFAIGCTNEYA